MFSETRARPDPAAANGFHFAVLGESAGAIAQEAKKRLTEAEEYVKELVTTRPALALGAALAAGVLIGWLIKRR
jgi:ElaB/YqjD/DUF883 family membrane-anchored ribosome-binding protein